VEWSGAGRVVEHQRGKSAGWMAPCGFERVDNSPGIGSLAQRDRGASALAALTHSAWLNQKLSYTQRGRSVSPKEERWEQRSGGNDKKLKDKHDRRKSNTIETRAT